MPDFGRRGGPRLAGRGALLTLGAVVMAALAGLQMLLETPAAPAPSGASSGASLGASSSKSSAGAPAAAERTARTGPAPFDYYVLALSWSPSFCLERPEADQCGQGRRFILHGLWPQFETGYPADCESRFRDPDRALLARYAGLTESAGLLAHQWRKHGRCSGLSAEDYLAAAARAVEAVRVPDSLRSAARDLDVDPRAIETAFVDANPGFGRDGVTIRCTENRLSEVRLCLTPDLAPRACGADVRRDCGARRIDLPAPK